MKRKNTLKVRFWGVRGSYPTPGAQTVKYGGNTSCVEVGAGEKIIILDAGTGIIPLGNHLCKNSAGAEGHRALVLISHYHFDHVQGLPFFRPAFLPTSKIYLYGPKFGGEGVLDALTRLMVSPMCPFDLRQMPGVMAEGEIKENERLVWGIAEDAPKTLPSGAANIDTKENILIESLINHEVHPRQGVALFRINYDGRSVVYATDVEGVHKEVINFCKDADLLIFDTMYKQTEYHNDKFSTKGWGHSTASMACETALKANVKRLALFHHSPDHDDATIDDKELQIQRKFPGAFSAYEGQTIEI